MAKALGVGGIFFKSTDPKRLNAWYAHWLGIDFGSDYAKSFYPNDLPANSYTVWCAFDANTDYFSPSQKEFMFNLIVDDLEGALKQVRNGGAQVGDKIQELKFGRFGWFIDPDGNKVELWEPTERGA